MQAEEKDIRWKQRLDNFSKAILTLESAVNLSHTRSLSDLEKQGLIQGFEFSFELAWNVMKDYLEEHGFVGIVGSKDAIRLAFNRGVILDGDLWMEMLRERNASSHSYNDKIAERIVNSIIGKYYYCLNEFAQKMKSMEQ